MNPTTTKSKKDSRRARKNEKRVLYPCGCEKLEIKKPFLVVYRYCSGKTQKERIGWPECSLVGPVGE